LTPHIGAEIGAEIGGVDLSASLSNEQLSSVYQAWLGSRLYITETPQSGGGDTLFADMQLAYELLSEAMKEMLMGRTAVHDGAPYGTITPTLATVNGCPSWAPSGLWPDP
jgi:alpha-ketoglutarate-dependent taurine dioxygenase